MPLYESTFIARQDVSSQDVEKIADNFAKVVDEHGGKVVKREHWGLRNLSYLIKKNRKGHYVMFGLDAPVKALDELKRQYKLSEDVIRDLTLRVDAISDEPSLMMRRSNDSKAGASGE